MTSWSSGAAGGDVEAAVAALAERHARPPDRARASRPAPASCAPPCRAPSAAGGASPSVRASRARPRAGRAHHRRARISPLLGHDPADRAAPVVDALDRAARGGASRRARRPRGERLGRLLGLGVAVARRVEAADPRPARPGTTRRISAGRDEPAYPGRTRAPPAATPRTAPCAPSSAASARLPPWIHSMSAPSSRSRPRQMRFDSTISGTSAGSRPCWRTKPQFFRDCSPATGARSTTTTRTPRRARKYAAAQPTMPAPTTTTSASRSMADAHRRSKAARCQSLPRADSGRRDREEPPVAGPGPPGVERRRRCGRRCARRCR